MYQTQRPELGRARHLFEAGAGAAAQDFRQDSVDHHPFRICLAACGARSG